MKVRMRFSSIPRQNGTLSVHPSPHLMQIEYFQSNYTLFTPTISYLLSSYNSITFIAFEYIVASY